MNNIIKNIEKLKELSGNAQLDYLVEQKDNMLLKEVLHYAYNPDLKYGVAEKAFNNAFDKLMIKYTKANLTFNEEPLNLVLWDDFKLYLDKLASQKGVKEEQLMSMIEDFWTRCSNADFELFKSVLYKDLKIGMGISSFNKVWPDFYFKYPYMGCRGYSEKNLSKIKYPAILQTKLDGLFCNCIVRNEAEHITYMSRQGKPINIIGSLESALKNATVKQDYVLNGEVLAWDKENDKPYPRAISNGIIRRDDKTQEELDSIVYVVWDIIPYEDFVRGVGDMSYEKRHFTLSSFVDNINSDKIRLVETKYVETEEEALEFYKEKREQGEEGVIVKNTFGIWKSGKGPNQVKIKAEEDCDLTMVEFIEGKGTYEGKCGSIRCISKCKELEVYVKPRTPEIANYIWQNQNECLDKIVAVKYNEKIKSPDKDTWSLYLPVFIEIRDDKDVADSLKDIK